jgi:hypothetical protein
MSIKLNPPSYSGVATLSKFENFITKLLWYLKVYQLYGLDHLRIQILGLTLTGNTGEWFNQIVDTNDPQSKTWDFESELPAIKNNLFTQHQLRIQLNNTMSYYN